jgi:hypothetical protein
MKKVVGQIKLHIPAGKATPAPPVGPALGQHGVNIMDFCKNFNARTAKEGGILTPVVITVYQDHSYTFITKTPPASVPPGQGRRGGEGLGHPEQGQGGEGDAGAGGGDRQDQAPRPQLQLAGGRGPDRHGKRPLHGHRSR